MIDLTTWKTVSLGLVRPRGILFFEIDFRAFRKLKNFAEKRFKAFSIYRTKHGYHLIAYPFRKKLFRALKRAFRTDFTMRFEKTILRIGPKFEEKTGKVVSPRPVKVYGNIELINIDEYKFSYWCKN